MTGNQNSVCQEVERQDERTCQSRDDISSEPGAKFTHIHTRTHTPSDRVLIKPVRRPLPG